MDHYASLKAAERYGREEGREEERIENKRKLKSAVAIVLKQGVSVENIALAYQMASEEVKALMDEDV